MNGVRYVEKTNRWNASISIDKKRKHLGSFIHEIDANNARNKANIDNNYYTGTFSKRDVTQENLKALLHYNPDTGLFTWCVNYGGHIVYGRVAGNTDSDERVGGKTYIRIKIYQQHISAHRLAFLYMTGKFPNELVDHKDGDGTNNKWDNLREATHTENNRNARVQHNNTSGTMGVSWNKAREKWQAQISDRGVIIYLGLYKHFEQAKLARLLAEKKYGYHENHGDIRPL